MLTFSRPWETLIDECESTSFFQWCMRWRALGYSSSGQSNTFDKVSLKLLLVSVHIWLKTPIWDAVLELVKICYLLVALVPADLVFLYQWVAPFHLGYVNVLLFWMSIHWQTLSYKWVRKLNSSNKLIYFVNIYSIWALAHWWQFMSLALRKLTVT